MSVLVDDRGADSSTASTATMTATTARSSIGRGKTEPAEERKKPVSSVQFGAATISLRTTGARSWWVLCLRACLLWPCGLCAVPAAFFEVARAADRRGWKCGPWGGTRGGWTFASGARGVVGTASMPFNPGGCLLLGWLHSVTGQPTTTTTTTKYTKLTLHPFHSLLHSLTTCRSRTGCRTSRSPRRARCSTTTAPGPRFRPTRLFHPAAVEDFF